MEKWFLTIFFPGIEHSMPIEESSAENAEAIASGLMTQAEIILRSPEGVTVIYPSKALGWKLTRATEPTGWASTSESLNQVSEAFRVQW